MYAKSQAQTQNVAPNYGNIQAYNAPKTQMQTQPQAQTSAVSDFAQTRNSNINIAQILKDFNNTAVAIGTPDDLKQEVDGYLQLIQTQVEKDNPNVKLIKSNLKNASTILDNYISQTLNKDSKVVENWVDALFLQQIDFKYNENDINPQFLVKFPENSNKAEKTSQTEETTTATETEETQETAETVAKEVENAVPKTTVKVPQDKELKSLFLQSKKLAYANEPKKAIETFQKALVRANEVGDNETKSKIYYEVGKENFCTRWNMEDAVEFGWRVSHLKYMAKAALVSRDWDVACKYLRLLKKTMWQGEWADKYMPYVGDAKKCWDDGELGFIMRLLPGSDRLDGDKTLVEMYLLQTFSHGMGADKNYAELTLMCALIMQDIDLFWPRFFRYAQLLEGERMPTHYQEAAYLYGQLEPGKVDISGMPFDESVKRSYYDFCRFNQQLGPDMSEAEKAVRFRPAFGNTFYYFYFLVRNVKTN